MHLWGKRDTFLHERTIRSNDKDIHYLLYSYLHNSIANWRLARVRKASNGLDSVNKAAMDIIMFTAHSDTAPSVAFLVLYSSGFCYILCDNLNLKWYFNFNSFAFINNGYISHSPVQPCHLFVPVPCQDLEF